MKKITIPKPCHENWALMSPDEKGRFCAVCEKSVFDFTQKKESEIVNLIQLQEGNICGRFRKSQILPENKIQKYAYQFHEFLNFNGIQNRFVLSFVILLLTVTGCKKEEKCETVTVGLLVVPEEIQQDSISSYELGEAKIPDDSLAQIPKNKEPKKMDSTNQK